ncbi:class I SAM-dependent methyltransferase [Microbulbifer echini]|uniref:Class I SAM-dependent methyltransferase n=1 Tax=Microbulbifer echini TaxID=1529067 RepID=A0ABV4NRA9_9GAMM|nr:class I SAM-dependent methyltransferase [uncultured Microbulbifer sp.]
MTDKSRSREPIEKSLLAKACPAMSHWFSSRLGQEILSQQLTLVQPLLEGFFGYHLLQAGVTDAVDFTASSRINHCFRLAVCAEQRGGALVELEQLPLPSESIDVVFLHHLLDFSSQPHQVLREAARVLIPGGHMLLVGFNPFSLLGLSRLLFSRGAYQKGNQLRAARVADWMNLLDLQAEQVHRGFFRLPIQQREVLAKTVWMERLATRLGLPWGGFYIIVARKEVSRVRAIKIDWRTERKPALVATPTSPRVAARGKHQKR